MSREPSPEDRAGATHRLLPSSIESERGLICSALLCSDDVLPLGASLDPKAFHLSTHQTVWESLQVMHRERIPIDPVTLTQYLADRQLLAAAGGPANVSELYTYLPTGANAEYYLQTIREKDILRKLIAVSHQTIERSYTDQDQVADVLEDAINRLVEISASRGNEHVRQIQPFVLKAIDEIEQHYNARGRVLGLPTGFTDLDRMIGGWQPGFNYYWGARPAMGKTSLGLNFAIATAAAALADGCPVLFFSLEMTGVQLAKRLVFTLAKINQQRARDGFLSKERDWKGMLAAAQQIASARLFVDETASLTIGEYRARTRAWVKKMRRQYGARANGRPDCMTVIDYLQRMKGSSKRSESARYLELQEIAIGISCTGKDLRIAQHVLAQLKRPKDKKPETEPDMSEFRESGDVEQEAHVVGLIHRPFYYVKHNTDKQIALAAEIEERFRRQAKFRGQDEKVIRFTVEDLERYAKLLIDKQREGPVGPIDLRFIADYTQFENWGDRPLYSNDAAQRQFTGRTDED